MITNLGKNVLSKYLIGQAPSYASHIAVGCGAVPVSDANDLADPSSKLSLDFEMFRVPISSRGYVKEDGVTKIVFSAELPTQERYEITELGLYSAGSNPSATGFDSRTLYTFSRQEQWKTFELVGNEIAESDLYVIDNPLNNNITTGDMAPIPDVSGDGEDHKTFQTNATNRIFANNFRRSRSEQLRYLNNMVLMRGNYGVLETTGTEPGINPDASSYISLLTSVNLQKNSSSDLLKIAFSLVNVNNNIDEGTNLPSQNPLKASTVVRFVNSDGAYAEMVYETEEGYDWAENRYVILEKPLSELVISSGFSWARVERVNLYGGVYSSLTTLSENFYIAFDAIRLENITSSNPLYGMTGYSAVVTADALPIVKLPNTSGTVEFRLGIGV